MNMIQLRVRTEFSFKNVFGPVNLVAKALQGCTHAAIVDSDTWGHVKWSYACEAAGIRPLFGCELVVPQEDGRKPTCWVLAEDTKALYRLSTAARVEGADVLSLLREARGVIRFAGAALTDPSTFDFVDINPGSRLAQMSAVRLSKETGKPLIVTSDNYYPTPDDRAAFLAMGGRERNTPQHIITSLEELHAAIPVLTKTQLQVAATLAENVAGRCATKLQQAPLIKVSGDIRAVAEAGRKSRHIKTWSEAYDSRLQRELDVIEQKEFSSYFLVVADLVKWAKQHMLVGPGRGSSAGSLVCYLTGITEVDPIKHDLLFERFIDLTRADLPDIDIDFDLSDTKREMLFNYLYETYGTANVARVGNINTLKPRSLMAGAFKRLGIPDYERFALIEALIQYPTGDSRYGKSIEDTFAYTEVGRAFLAKYDEAKVITQIENHASHTGVHAAGIIVSMEPVTDYCTVVDGVARVDKPDAETLNLLKIDALGLRTLGVLEDAGIEIDGNVLKGKDLCDWLYQLPLDDPKVFKIFNDKKFSSVFQFEGAAQRAISAQVTIDSFETLDQITALARPGPMGAGAPDRYIARKAGKELGTSLHPALDPIIKDTYGVVLYQEQVMRIVREIGKFSWEDTTYIRKAMGRSKGAEFFNQKAAQFIEGAKSNGIDEETAKELWGGLVTFGGWAMNRSHTCSYAVISYWCAWMKAYHPLNYAAACLRGAKDDEGRLAVLRELKQEGIGYIAFDLKRSQMDWSVQEGELIGGFLNYHGIGPAKAIKLIEARDKGKIVDLEKYTQKFVDLYPLQTAYPKRYSAEVRRKIIEKGLELARAEFRKNGKKSFLKAEVREKAEPLIREMFLEMGEKDLNIEFDVAADSVLTSDKFPEKGKVSYIGRIIEKRPFDMNEPARVERRGGKKYDGNTLAIDFRTKDDLGETILCRVNGFNWEKIGKPASEKLDVGDDIAVLGDRVKGFAMINVTRIECLNKPELEWPAT